MLPSERDNLPIWTGQAGWQESYILKICDPRQGVAMWLRYALFAPEEGDPFAELWGMAFNGAGANKHIILRDVLPIDQVRLDTEPFAFQIGRAVLTNRGARGRIEHHDQRLGWVLNWEPNEESFRHFPNRAFYEGPYPPTKMLAPNPELRITGEVLFNRRRIELIDAPAIQLHTWGTKLALGGIWAHCNTFAEDETAVFEGLSQTPRKVGPLEPNVTVFRFVIDGEEYLANGLYKLFTSKSRYDTGGWFFEATCGDRRFEGSIEAPYQRMAGVVVQDPDGELAYCYQTQIADMSLRVFVKERGKWVLERELTSQASCAMEVMTRDPDPELPVVIEEPATVER